MTWWANQSLQLKNKYSFLLVIGGSEIYNVSTVTKPKATTDIQEYKLMNHYYKYPGLVKWDPVEISLVDVSLKGLDHTSWKNSSALWEMLLKTGYTPPLNVFLDPSMSDEDRLAYIGDNTETVRTVDHIRNPKAPFLSSPEKASTMDNAFIMPIRLIHLDKDTGAGMEDWRLFNPIISKIDWGDYDYNSDEATVLTMTIDYDYAVFRDKAQMEGDNDLYLRKIE
jgi:hypothetical protein